MREDQKSPAQMPVTANQIQKSTRTVHAATFQTQCLAASLSPPPNKKQTNRESSFKQLMMTGEPAKGASKIVAIMGVFLQTQRCCHRPAYEASTRALPTPEAPSD